MQARPVIAVAELGRSLREHAMRTPLAVLFLVAVVGCTAPSHEAQQASLPLETSSPIRVVVCGEVQHPHEYCFLTGIRLADAINRAGGFSEQAARKAVTVLRKDGTFYKYDLRPGKRGHGGDAVLRDGDTVLVPQRLS